MIRNLQALFCLLAFMVSASGNDDFTGDASIRSSVGDSEIVITTTERLAGAIHSLIWNGKEFIDSHDHGRQLQSAANFDAGSRFSGETFNPTEAGSRRDGAGPWSTSRLLQLVATRNSLQTTNHMAFWLAPGETSGGRPAKNTTLLSNHLLTKRVTIGDRDLPQVQYDVLAFRNGEGHEVELRLSHTQSERHRSGRAFVPQLCYRGRSRIGRRLVEQAARGVRAASSFRCP